MDQERLRRRVGRAVERAARKFSPSVKIVRKNGDAASCVASLVVENAPEMVGASVGLRGTLLFAEDEWARVGADDASFVVDSVEWFIEKEAAPVVWKDRLGVVSVAVWRPLVSR